MKSLTFFILASLLSFHSSLACLHAEQEKIYPIGLTDEGLVALHVDMLRDNGTEFSITWQCTSSLKFYSKSNQVIASINIDSNDLFGKDTLLAKLTHYYADAFEMASQIPGIRLFKPQKMTFCDFGVDCSLGQYRVDTTNESITIIYENKKLDLKESILGSVINNHYKDKLHAARFLEISSVRVFTIENKTLLLYHLGTGDKGSPADGSEIVPEEYTPDAEFNSLTNSIYVEPILHHGYGFDVFIWL